MRRALIALFALKKPALWKDVLLDRRWTAWKLIDG